MKSWESYLDVKSKVITDPVCILNLRVLCQTRLIPVRGLQPALEHQESFDFSSPTSNTNTSTGMQLKSRNDNGGESLWLRG